MGSFLALNLVLIHLRGSPSLSLQGGGIHWKRNEPGAKQFDAGSRRWCMNRDRRRNDPQSAVSPTDTIGPWPSECGHLIQDVAREQRLGDLSVWTPRAKRLAD